MGTDILHLSKNIWLPRKREPRPTRFYSAYHPVQNKTGIIAYVTNLVRWLLWTTTAIVATIITGSILLEFVGYYGAFNWLINTIYGASTIIMKVVGWN
jgi:uncharacterized membrane protein